MCIRDSYRIHTPEYDSRLKPRKVQWRKGEPPVVTDERRPFVANLERATKAMEKERCELEVGRRRLDVGRESAASSTSSRGQATP